MRALAILAAITGVITALPARVDAVLCVTKRHTLGVREACKPKEAATDPAGLGAVGARGATGALGVSLPRLRVFDSNEAFVGYVNAHGDLLLPLDGRVIYVNAGTEGIRPGGSLYFETPDCTGSALVSGPGLLARNAPVHGTTAYYPADPVALHDIGSFLYVTTADSCVAGGGTFDPSAGLCCSGYVSSFESGPAVPVDVSRFSPPFRLEIDR